MKKTNIAAGLITCLFTVSAMMNVANAQSWSLNGNAGTTSTNFIGTTDAKAFTIKTNNSKRVTISSGGKIGVGTTTPTSKLHVLGGTNGGDTLPVILGLVKRTGNVDMIGVQGTSQPAAGYGIGVSGTGNFVGLFGNGGTFGVAGISGNVGVDGEASEAGTTNSLTGVQGLCSGGDLSVGVYGNCTGANTNIGVYGDEQDTTNSPDYAVASVGDLFFWRAFSPSDAKLKTNIQPYTGALDKIGQLNATTYVFDKTKYPGMKLPSGTQTGFLAEELQKVFPDLVKQGAIPAGATRDARGKVTYHSIDKMMAVNYIGLIPVLAEAIKEQKLVVDQKDALIAEQADRITQLENKFNQLANLMQQTGQITEQQKNAIVKTADNAKLFQNQPNPVNGNSTINVYLPSTVKSANLEITNAAGVVLKNITISERGNSEVILNGGDYAAGNYTYSLLVDGKVIDSKTMIMTK